MHIAGKEQTVRAKPVHEVLAFGVTVPEGECDIFGIDVLSNIFRLRPNQMRPRTYRATRDYLASLGGAGSLMGI
jgi:hypothetical protein